jgi:hypothetical protein
LANEKNLRPFDKRTVSEQREISKKGGKASGESRRRKKAFKTTLNEMLNNNFVLSADEQRLYGKFNIPITNDNTVQERLLAVLMVNALKGDLPSLKYIAEISGDDPKLKLMQQEFNLKKKIAQMGAGGERLHLRNPPEDSRTHERRRQWKRKRNRRCQRNRPGT